LLGATGKSVLLAKWINVISLQIQLNEDVAASRTNKRSELESAIYIHQLGGDDTTLETKC